jgi:ferredoxin
MGEIESKDYETITARCGECGSLCTFNRVDDIGDPGPYYSGRYVACTECGRPFWVFGDTIDPAYELLIFDAEQHIRRKRYMLCVTSLAQAWEMFFATFVYSNYLYRPFYRDVRHPEKRERFDYLVEQLGDAIRKFTFDRLRNVLVNTVVEGVRPRTLDEIEVAIARIQGDNFAQQPAKVRVDAFADSSVRAVLLQLQGLRIGELRDRVVREDAYRPHRAEAEECGDEIRVLYRAKGRLAVRTLDEWRLFATASPRST